MKYTYIHPYSKLPVNETDISFTVEDKPEEGIVVGFLLLKRKGQASLELRYSRNFQDDNTEDYQSILIDVRDLKIFGQYQTPILVWRHRVIGYALKEPSFPENRLKSESRF